MSDPIQILNDKCVSCGACVKACPFDAIQFSKVYNVVSLSRDDFSRMDMVKQLAARRQVWAQTQPPPAAGTAAAPAIAPKPQDPKAP